MLVFHKVTRPTALALAVMLGVSAAHAEVRRLSQSGFAETVIRAPSEDGTTWVTVGERRVAWAGGLEQNMGLLARVLTPNTDSDTSVGTAVSPSEVRMSLGHGSRRIVSSSESVVARLDARLAFELTEARTAVPRVDGLVTSSVFPNGDEPLVSLDLYRVTDAGASPIALRSGQATVLSAGRYEIRGTSSLQVSASLLRRSGSGSMGSVLGLTLSEVATTLRGPDPVADIGGKPGPFAVTSMVIPQPAGYRAGTVYAPTGTTEGPFAVAVFVPGPLGGQKQHAWLAQHLASHGFVSVVIDTQSLFDNSQARNLQAANAMQQVIAWSAQAGTPLAGRIDPARQIVLGQGAGQPLPFIAAGSAVQAAVALAPQVASKDRVPGPVKAPTLVVGCQADIVQPVATHARPLYIDWLRTDLEPRNPKAFLMVTGGATGSCTTHLATTEQKALVGHAVTAWLKRMVDLDARYTRHLCGDWGLQGRPGVVEFYPACER